MNTLTLQQFVVALAEYDRTMRGIARISDHDVVAEVAADTHGEVYGEVIDTAARLGFPPPATTGYPIRRVFEGIVATYRAELAQEIEGRVLCDMCAERDAPSLEAMICDDCAIALARQARNAD